MTKTDNFWDTNSIALFRYRKIAISVAEEKLHRPFRNVAMLQRLARPIRYRTHYHIYGFIHHLLSALPRLKRAFDVSNHDMYSVCRSEDMEISRSFDGPALCESFSEFSCTFHDLLLVNKD